MNKNHGFNDGGFDESLDQMDTTASGNLSSLNQVAKQQICSRSLVREVISTVSAGRPALLFTSLQIWLDRQELHSQCWL